MIPTRFFSFLFFKGLTCVAIHDILDESSLMVESILSSNGNRTPELVSRGLTELSDDSFTMLSLKICTNLSIPRGYLAKAFR